MDYVDSLSHFIEGNSFKKNSRNNKIIRIYGDATGETLIRVDSRWWEDILNFAECLPYLGDVLDEVKKRRFYDSWWDQSYEVVYFEAKGKNTLVKVVLEDKTEKMENFSDLLYSSVVS